MAKAQGLFGLPGFCSIQVPFFVVTLNERGSKGGKNGDGDIPRTQPGPPRAKPSPPACNPEAQWMMLKDMAKKMSKK